MRMQVDGNFSVVRFYCYFQWLEISGRIRWCPRPESNRYDLAVEGFSYHFGFRRQRWALFVVWSTPSP
ncbi:hypothetical protein HMPREF0004_1831 [Achromobacter piechaudii ATCC 43553]|uniref:Uncharacterized protein n=1 Tax=Achromobacter piechaudii ATCC 43553 TaxID=742159 RepID=D4X8N4_9BURK|nr:hypothetical protein HMPREF0004_1831 [Achromobacter piechaudii ATCC 43553]